MHHDADAARLAAAFVDGGSDGRAVRRVRLELPTVPLIAPGRCGAGWTSPGIALGADLGAMAGPFLKAAAESPEAVLRAIGLVVDELRLVMFATGSGNLPALRQARLVAVE
jgi:isopentenyl-diphosphate delta-isomerase